MGEENIIWEGGFVGNKFSSVFLIVKIKRGN